MSVGGRGLGGGSVGYRTERGNRLGKHRVSLAFTQDTGPTASTSADAGHTATQALPTWTNTQPICLKELDGAPIDLNDPGDPGQFWGLGPKEDEVPPTNSDTKTRTESNAKKRPKDKHLKGNKNIMKKSVFTKADRKLMDAMLTRIKSAKSENSIRGKSQAITASRSLPLCEPPGAPHALGRRHSSAQNLPSSSALPTPPRTSLTPPPSPPASDAKRTSSALTPDRTRPTKKSRKGKEKVTTENSTDTDMDTDTGEAEDMGIDPFVTKLGKSLSQSSISELPSDPPFDTMATNHGIVAEMGLYSRDRGSQPTMLMNHPQPPKPSTTGFPRSSSDPVQSTSSNTSQIETSLRPSQQAPKPVPRTHDILANKEKAQELKRKQRELERSGRKSALSKAPDDPRPDSRTLIRKTQTISPAHIPPTSTFKPPIVPKAKFVAPQGPISPAVTPKQEEQRPRGARLGMTVRTKSSIYQAKFFGS